MLQVNDDVKNSLVLSIESDNSEDESTGIESSSDDSDSYDSSSESDSEEEDKSWQVKDSLGFIPFVMIVCVLFTCIGTIIWGCYQPRLECDIYWPSVSSASRFRPQRQLFSAGIFLSSLFWLVILILFSWYSRLVLSQADKRNRLITSATIVFGLFSVGSLMTLALLDPKSHLSSYKSTAVFFFVTTWISAGCITYARRRLSKVSRRSSNPMRKTSEWIVMGGICFTVLHGILFLFVYDYWYNIFGFTPTNVAWCEYAVITLLLFFVGTFRAEINALSRVVEDRYLQSITRTK